MMILDTAPRLQQQALEYASEAMMGAEMQSQMRLAMPPSFQCIRAASARPSAESRTAGMPFPSAVSSMVDATRPAVLHKLEEIELQRGLQRRQQQARLMAEQATGASAKMPWMPPHSAVATSSSSAAADVTAALALRIAARLPPVTRQTGRSPSKMGGLQHLVDSQSTRSMLVNSDVREEEGSPGMRGVFIDKAQGMSHAAAYEREGRVVGDARDAPPRAVEGRRRWEAPTQHQQQLLRDQQRSEMIGGWTDEVRGLSETLRRMETTQEAVRITREQAEAGRRERQVSASWEISGLRVDLRVGPPLRGT